MPGRTPNILFSAPKQLPDRDVDHNLSLSDSGSLSYTQTNTTRMPSHAGDRILSYGDVLLRRQDLQLLSGPFWLNDQVRDLGILIS